MAQFCAPSSLPANKAFFRLRAIGRMHETCKLSAVNPEAYLTDVLTKLVNGWPDSRLAELTPWAWAADHRSLPH